MIGLLRIADSNQIKESTTWTSTVNTATNVMNYIVE